MLLLPFENITYKTHLKKEEVLKRLMDAVEPKRNYMSLMFSTGSSKPYNGEIVADKFKIRRNIYYRNSFLPVIEGRIETGFADTVIRVKMRLQNYTLIFMTIWLLGVSSFLAIFQLLGQAFQINMGTIIPIIMLVFGYGMTIGAFKYESTRAINGLKTLFDAEIVKE